MPSPPSAFLASARPQGTHPTRSGPVDLPILYNDASVVSALFRVPPERMAAVLGDLRLEPIRLAGRATVVLTIFSYRDTSIGPYNELSITSFVRRTDDRRLRAAAFWVHALPVTTESACGAGLDIWGYPKWVTPIDYRHEGATISAGLPGELMLDLRPGASPPLPVRASFDTFTELDGRLVRTRVALRSRLRLVRSGRTALRIEGPGRAADLLDRLGCTRTRPSFAVWCERFEAILPPGKLLGPSRRDAGGGSRPGPQTQVRAS